MRVIYDRLGDVYATDGSLLHSGVRILQDDQRRIAVFVGKRVAPPVAVYAPGEVSFTKGGKCSTCAGYPARKSMWVAWEKHDKQQVDA